MASKELVLFDSDKGEYQIQFKNSKGDTQVRDRVHVISSMETGEAVNVFLGFAKDQPGLRRAAVSVLCRILMHSMDKLGAFQGSGDKTKPLAPELRDAFQDAESVYFGQFMDDKHKLHKSFVAKLPKANDRGEPLEVGGKLNVQAQFQYFLRTMRKAPSYANAKNTVLSYYSLVGALPYLNEKPDGTFDIVPPEVMRVMANNERIYEANDNSYKARLYAMFREVVSEGKNPPDEDIAEIARVATELAAHLATLAKAAETRAKVKPGDIVAQTQQAMDKANAKLPANGPTEGKAKVKAEA